jgi:hypothetical protein
MAPVTITTPDPEAGESQRFLERAAVLTPATPQAPRSRSEKLFVLTVLVFFAVLCLASVRSETVTSNEMIHIPAGLSYWQRFDARLNIEHPPLIKLIAAAPLLLLHTKASYGDSTWGAPPRAELSAETLFGQSFFQSDFNRGPALFLARLPMIALTILLGLSMYEIARQLAGPWGAALTLILFATSPFFVSYGSLVLTDIPLALFSIWTIWYFASLWRDSSKRSVILFAGSLAGALLTKFSAVFLFPALLFCWLWFRLSRKNPNAFGKTASGHEGFRRERRALAGVALAGLIVYVFYLGIFHRSNPLTILQNEITSLSLDGRPIYLLFRSVKIMTKYSALERPLLPVWLYTGGLAFVKAWDSRPLYFLGHWREHGVWFYFPAMSFFKLAPGMVLLFLLLAILATAHFLGNGREGFSITPDSNRFHLRAVFVTLILFAAISMASDLNVGVRHFSVPIVLGSVLCSLIIPLMKSTLGARTRPLARSATVALVFSCIVTALLAYPHYLSYFNVFRLDMPKYEIAQNSNLNWGQSMAALKTFFDERHVSAPYVDDHLAPLDPSVYIPGARKWECESPASINQEWVAVSPDRLVHEAPNCAQLLSYPSWTLGGGSVFVFHITK